MTRRIAALLCAAAILALPSTAGAHPFGQRPVAYISRDAGGVTLDWVIAQDEVEVLATHLKLGPIRAEALAPSPAFVEYMRGRVLIAEHPTERSCAMADTVEGRQVSSGWSLRTRFDCGGAPDQIALTVTMLHDVSEDYVTLWQAATDDGRTRGALTASRPLALVSFEAGTVALPTPTPAGGARPTTFIGRVIDAMQSGVGVPLALALALLLGALHALAPGHGKTIAAAVMVSGAGARHAVRLAAAVAGTHLLSVGVLTGVMVAAGRFTVPSAAQPVLQAIAGMLALVIAVRIWLRATPADTAHDHGAHDHGARRSLLAGIVGGLVPSPGAVALSLVAFASGRWVLGVIALAVFSIGLGSIVFGVALIAARGRALVAGTDRRAIVVARVAAVAIAVSGLALLVTAIVR